MKDHIKKLKILGACAEGIAFAEKYDTWQEVWGNIPRGDWALWFIGKNAGGIGSPERLRLVGIAAECAGLVLLIYEKRYPDDKRVRECIETLKRYAVGKATLEEVRAARKAAADSAAYATAAAYAYSAAADAYAAAAYAAAAAADAYAAYAAYAAADAYAAAAAAYAAYAAKENMSKQCADIVRKYYPIAPKLQP